MIKDSGIQLCHGTPPNPDPTCIHPHCPDSAAVEAEPTKGAELIIQPLCPSPPHPHPYLHPLRQHPHCPDSAAVEAEPAMVAEHCDRSVIKTDGKQLPTAGGGRRDR